MIKSCVYIPEKGADTFLKLKKEFGYETAKKVYLKAINPQFQRDYKSSLKLDGDGVPTYESLMKNRYIKDFIGNTRLIQSAERTFQTLPDNIENYQKQLADARAFNENPENRDLAAYVDYDSKGNLIVKIAERTQESIGRFNNQMSSMSLNRKLEEMFKPLGITVGRLTEAEQSAGRTGVTDFSKAKGIARDLASVIRVANSKEGAESVSEEFSHLVLGIMEKDPLVDRLLNMLQDDEDALKQILGDQYEDTEEFQDNNRRNTAMEALGKLLQQNLLKHSMEAPHKTKTLLGRLVEKIRNMFKKFSDIEISKAVIEADSAMSTLAKNMLSGGIEFRDRDLEKIASDAQFNNLSSMIERNISILKQAQDTEMKRYAIHDISKDTANNIIKGLDAFTKPDRDTVMGIMVYASQAINELRDFEEQFKTFDDKNAKERYSFLRKVRRYLTSYGPFIEALSDISVDERDTRELFENKTMVDENGTAVTMNIETVLHDLNALNGKLSNNFNLYGKREFLEFLKPYFGYEGEITVPFGKHKGTKMSLQGLINEVEGDISMFDMWLDSMADSGDILLQLFDKAYKMASDAARTDTMSHVRMVQELMDEADQAGITEFEWAFERYSDGTKTGDYLSEVNNSQYERDRKEFEKYLSDKYGKNPSGEKAQQKLAERNLWRKGDATTQGHAIMMNGKWVANPITYRNSDYDNLSEAQKNILHKFLSLKLIADSRLRPDTTHNTKAIQIRKSGVQRILDSAQSPEAIWKNIQGQVNSAIFDQTDDDQQFGVKTGLVGFDGKEYMMLPTIYIASIENPDELSTDIFGTLMSYFYMADRYSQLSKIVDPMEIGRTIVSETRKVNGMRGDKPIVQKTTGFGRKMVNRVYALNDSNIQAKLDDFFESQIYGRHLKDAGSWEILGKQVNKDKLTNLLLKYSSLAQLGFNWLANMANVTTGVAMQNIEAAACEYFTPKQLASADKEYLELLIPYVGEIGDRYKTNKLALFDDLFDIKQDYKGRLLNSKKKSILQRVFGENIAFLGQDAGDHWLYNRTAIAMCKAFKVKVPDGRGGFTMSNLWDELKIRNSKDTFKENDKIKEMYLPEGIVDENGNSINLKEIGRKILHVNQGLFGVYNEEDSNMANRVALGRLLMQYKKWMKPQLNKRFKKAGYNVTSGDWEEGYYRTFGRVITELIRGSYQIGALSDQLTDHEKANINRAIFELVQCFAVYALANWIDWDDDKERPWAEKMAEYAAQRLAHELGNLTPIPYAPGTSVPMLKENLKTLKTPIASMSVLQNAANFIGSVVNPEEWNDTIQSGTFKGHSTLYKNTMKAPIPIVAQYKMLDRFFNDLDTSIAYYIRAY